MKQEQDANFKGIFREIFLEINIYMWKIGKKRKFRNSVVEIYLKEKMERRKSLKINLIKIYRIEELSFWNKR